MALIAWCLLAFCLILLVLLPTGAFTMTLVVVTAVLSLGLAALALLGRPSEHAPPLRGQRWVTWACVLLLGLFWITLIPLPASIGFPAGKLRKAQNVHAYETIENVVALEMMEPEPQGYALTRNRSGTARVALLAGAAIAAALLASRMGPRARSLYLRFVLILGLVIAVLGYISMRSKPQGDNLWWIYPVPHGLPGPIACFTNPNHFAAFLAILCPIALALFVHDIGKLRIIRAAVSLGSFAFLVLTIVYTQSRGALVGLSCGMLVCTAVYFLHRRWIPGIVLIGIGVCAVVSILSIPHPLIRERLQTFLDLKSTDSYQTRVAAWSDCKTIFKHYPVFGAGANGYRVVYPQFRTTSQGAQMTSHAENEYVQWAVDTGILGILAALILLMCYGRTAIVPRLKSTDDAVLTVATLGVLGTAAAHSFLDYPLHIPLYAIPLASIAGLILPQELTQLSGTSMRERAISALPVLCVALLSVGLVRAWGNRLHYDSVHHMHRGELSTIARALRYSPNHPFAWYYLGRKVSRTKTPETRLLAIQCLTRAGDLDPNNYKLWYRIGRRLHNLKAPEAAARAFARVKELRDWHNVPYLPEDLNKPPTP